MVWFREGCFIHQLIYYVRILSHFLEMNRKKKSRNLSNKKIVKLCSVKKDTKSIYKESANEQRAIRIEKTSQPYGINQ